MWGLVPPQTVYSNAASIASNRTVYSNAASIASNRTVYSNATAITLYTCITCAHTCYWNIRMDMVKVAVESRNPVFRKSGHSKKLVVFFRRMFQHKLQSCTRIVPK